MDIFRLLRKEHAEAMDDLKAWIRMPIGAGGADACLRWSERWEVHARIEENFLFPLIRGEPDLRRLSEQAVAGHDAIRRRLRQMQAAYREAEVRQEGARDEALSGLLESLESLLEMEERRLFPAADDLLNGETSEELGREVEDFLRGLHSALAAG